MKKVVITIREDEGELIATFNICGGGTQASSMHELLDNCKEVLDLLLCAKCHNPLSMNEYKLYQDEYICNKCSPQKLKADKIAPTPDRKEFFAALFGMLRDKFGRK